MELGFRQLIFLSATIVVIIIGFMIVSSLTSTAEDADLILFTNEFTQDLDKARMQQSKILKDYVLPSSIEYVILVDQGYKDVLLEDPFILSEPLIYDALETSEEKNVFFFSRAGHLIQTAYVGSIDIGKFGDSGCNGYARVESLGNRLRIPIISRPGNVFIGESCGLKYETVSGPFVLNTNIENLTNTKIARTKLRISLNIDEFVDVGKYLQSGSFWTKPINLDYTTKLERLYYKVLEPTGTNIAFQVGFLVDDNWTFVGPNGPQSFYESYGELIVVPDDLAEYEKIRVAAFLSASSNKLQSPEVYSISIGNYGYGTGEIESSTEINEDYCNSAELAGLCNELDLNYDFEGYQEGCCDLYSLCC